MEKDEKTGAVLKVFLKEVSAGEGNNCLSRIYTSRQIDMPLEVLPYCDVVVVE